MRPQNKYFVVPMGDELNNFIAKNFEEALDHSQITLVTETSRVHVKAWELSLEDVRRLRTSLKTEGFDFNIQVAIQINDGDIRWARPEEYNPVRKRQKMLEKETCTTILKTAPARTKRIQRPQPSYVALQPPKPKIRVPGHPELNLWDKKG